MSGYNYLYHTPRYVTSAPTTTSHIRTHSAPQLQPQVLPAMQMQITPSQQQHHQQLEQQLIRWSQRPKFASTFWEEEGTVCFQVDARGVCVTRRQDNDMVNGTKLLNVTGMSRGKRDGILKNERGRVVVKVGAMHLKGVWITFARAKALSEQFNITDALHPLFTNDPTLYLYTNPDPPAQSPIYFLPPNHQHTYPTHQQSASYLATTTPAPPSLPNHSSFMSVPASQPSQPVQPVQPVQLTQPAQPIQPIQPVQYIAKQEPMITTTATEMSQTDEPNSPLFFDLGDYTSKNGSVLSVLTSSDSAPSTPVQQQMMQSYDPSALHRMFQQPMPDIPPISGPSPSLSTERHEFYRTKMVPHHSHQQSYHDDMMNSFIGHHSRAQFAYSFSLQEE
ncbi:hypothetical protein DFQ28_004099 [Apophysomyces sp. BC1034]|nr:hypothetical protein DFQ30_001353 [Apophysomyces sp. BC1015]KAG0182457.1 hypothetical protein DFQ29_004079 [Apophysomyces sp. BC1021]KAG0193658.1 hypothetical protein DFQ28_004099 [Apophysomyces sp. BC1034]